MSATPIILEQTKVPAQLGNHFQVFNGQSVHELDGSTAHWVYFIRAEALESPLWRTLRVHLTHAHRWFIVYGSEKSSGTIVTALRDGAFDYIFTNDPADRWAEAMERAAQSQQLWLQLYGSRFAGETPALIGKSATIRSLIQTIDRVGPTPTNVLINGESGTGKERVAEALHKASGLSGPFLPVNCAAIPRELLESELFGSEKGGFTGAVKSRPGLVEQAAGGTLFLDEIGELDLSLQPKLLRFIESRRARRVGGSSEYAVEARILSATNQDIEQQIERNQFRADLYYRLSEIVLKVAPLRNHAEDIPNLAAHFLDEANEKIGKHFVAIEPTLLSDMMAYSWPGNVRELRATIHRLTILHDGPIVRREWWEAPTPSPAPQFASANPAPASYAPPQSSLNRRQKWEWASELLRGSGNDQTWASAQLGVHPTTLFRWIKSGKVKLGAAEAR